LVVNAAEHLSLWDRRVSRRLIIVRQHDGFERDVAPKPGVNSQIDDAMSASANLLEHAEPAEGVANFQLTVLARGRPVIQQQVQGAIQAG
jgi:hypothetical protein